VLVLPRAVEVVNEELTGLSKILCELPAPRAIVADENADLLVARPPKPQLFRGGACDSRDLGRGQGCDSEALDLGTNALSDPGSELHSSYGDCRGAARCAESV
jgi:hypothetical protein